MMNSEHKYTRHYECVEIVIPKENDAYDGCPLRNENCYDCEYLLRSGTLGGEVWIDCSYGYEDEKEEGQ